VLGYTRMESLTWVKHSSLLGKFVSYEENKVLWIRPLLLIPHEFYITILLISYKLFHILHKCLWKSKEIFNVESALSNNFKSLNSKFVVISWGVWILKKNSFTLFKCFGASYSVPNKGLGNPYWRGRLSTVDLLVIKVVSVNIFLGAAFIFCSSS
jgi:hypothetical protein